VPRVAVTASGPDRPGVVAAVTGVLLGHGATMEDTSMTVLEGHLWLMMAVETPEGEAPESLEVALAGEVGALGLTVAVRSLEGVLPSPTGAATRWEVGLAGADRPGAVHRVTRLLADRGANIVDLRTSHRPAAGGPGTVLGLEVVLPPEADAARLGAELDALAAELGVTVQFVPVEQRD
jgi:glycine cleavage system transcriptional repressor